MYIIVNSFKLDIFLIEIIRCICNLQRHDQEVTLWKQHQDWTWFTSCSKNFYSEIGCHLEACLFVAKALAFMGSSLDSLSLPPIVSVLCLYCFQFFEGLVVVEIFLCKFFYSIKIIILYYIKYSRLILFKSGDCVVVSLKKKRKKQLPWFVYKSNKFLSNWEYHAFSPYHWRR